MKPAKFQQTSKQNQQKTVKPRAAAMTPAQRGLSLGLGALPSRFDIHAFWRQGAGASARPVCSMESWGRVIDYDGHFVNALDRLRGECKERASDESDARTDRRSGEVMSGKDACTAANQRGARSCRARMSSADRLLGARARLN